MRLRNNYKMGYLAEDDVKVISSKVRIPSITKTAKYRIPDIMTDNALIEIKNVKRLRLTRQIKDFILYSKQTNRKLILYVRMDTRLSRQLLDLIENGEIEINYLRRIYTEEARAKICKDMLPYIRAALRGDTSKLNFSE